MTPLPPETWITPSRKITPYIPLLGFIVIAVVFAVTSFQAFIQVEGLIVKDKIQDLDSIADLKMRQISDWKQKQIRRGESFTNASFLPDQFDQWLRQGMPREGKEKILRFLASMQYMQGYKDITLFDKDGRARLSTMRGDQQDADDVAMARAAIGNRQVSMSDIHMGGAHSDEIRIDLAAPLISLDGNGEQVMGAVVFQIDPHEFLYPLMRAWPFPSPSAETLLVRREGDDVLPLSELRHKKGTALSLRQPLTKTSLPGVMAILGKTSSDVGVDYRGVQVVSAMRKVPGTHWFIVSKIDKEEFLAPVARLKQWSMTLGLALALIGGMLVFFWLKAYQVRYKYLKDQHDAAVEHEAERKSAEDALRKSEALLKASQQMAHIGSWELDLVENVLSWSDENYRIFEVDRARFGAAYEAFLAKVHPDDLAMVNQAYTDSVKNKTPYRIVHRLLLPPQRVKYVEEWCETYYDEDGQPLRSVGTTQDVTERHLFEESLARKQEFIREVVDAVPNLIFVKGPNGRFLLVNQAMAALHHKTTEALLGQDGVELFPRREDYELHLKADREALETRRKVVLIAHNVLDGKEKWLLVTKVPMAQPDGTVNILGVVEDITEKRLAEDRLRKSADEIEDLYDNAPCGYHSLDQNGVFVRINNTELQWLGYTRDELIGKMKISDLYTPRSREIFAKSFHRFKEKGSIHGLEFEMVRKDGTQISVLLSATAIYDPHGRFVMSRSTMYDISDRKLAEKRLFESEERFRTMADNAPIMIWMANAGGEQEYTGCNFFNARWHEFTGLALEQLQGYHWISIVHPGDRERCLDVYIRAFEEAREFKLEYRLRRHDGAYRWIRDSGVPRFTAEEEFLGFIGTCVDITDQKLFEELRAEIEHVGRLNIAGEMASGLAHELSQPLTAASNYLDGCLHRMQDAEWDREKLQQAVKLAHLQTERAGSIINHLKDLIRKQGHERVMLDINELIKDSVDFMEHDLSRQSIRVISCIFPTCPRSG